MIAGNLTVTVAVEFEAAHRLVAPDRDDRWNLETYGPCSRPSGHGHGYRLETTVAAPIDERSGFAIDGRVLRTLVEELVAKPCGNRHLNHDVPFLAGVNPTAENLVRVFAERVASRLPHGALASMVLHETPKNRATWLAEAAS